MPTLTKGHRKAKRKQALAKLGWEKPSTMGSNITPREWALRILHEKGFDFDKAISSLQGRIKTHRKQAVDNLKEGKKSLAVLERDMSTTNAQAIKELEYLQKKGVGFWVPKATKILNRDLLAGVKENPNKRMSVEEQTSLLLGLAGVGSKSEPREELVARGLSARRGETESHLEKSLQGAIYIAEGGVQVTQRFIDKGKRNKAPEKVMRELERAKQRDEALLAFLHRINRMRPEIKYSRIRELMSGSLKRRPFKPPFELKGKP